MYHHTQSGTVTRIAALAGLAVSVATLVLVGSSLVLWLLVAFAWLAVLGFSSMTITIDQERLTFWFGPGLLRHGFPLRDIQSFLPVRNPWWYGWGIHMTPDGWLYNVGGRDAVQVEFRDGRRLRLGTDEPTILYETLKLMTGRSAEA